MAYTAKEKQAIQLLKRANKRLDTIDARTASNKEMFKTSNILAKAIKLLKEKK